MTINIMHLNIKNKTIKLWIKYNEVQCIKTKIKQRLLTEMNSKIELQVIYISYNKDHHSKNMNKKLCQNKS